MNNCGCEAVELDDGKKISYSSSSQLKLTREQTNWWNSLFWQVVWTNVTKVREFTLLLWMK